MQDFETLRTSTYCPFALKAKVWRLPEWDASDRYEGNIHKQAESLAEFAQVCKSERYHGCAARLPVDDHSNFENVKAQFHRYLVQLALNDISCAQAMAGDFLAPTWQFEFRNIRMFLNVFGACYSKQHSKYAPVDSSFLVFFQPESSFDLCGTNSITKKTKQEIRDRFARAGMPYNGEQIDQRIESLLYMFPVDHNSPPVRWWE